MPNPSYGTLHCVCISRIKNLPEMDLKIFAVRKKMFHPEGWVHSTNLAPSGQLLAAAKKMEKEGTWTEETFKEHYEPRFREELDNNPHVRPELANIVGELKSGKDVALACYCGDKNKCHRGIIGELFSKSGYRVEYN